MTAPRKPQDHKSKASTADGYPMKIGARTYVLAPPSAGLMRSVRRRDPMDLMFTLFEACSPDLECDDNGDPLDPPSSPFLTALDSLPGEELYPLFTGWMEAFGGGDAGKSGRSSS